MARRKNLPFKVVGKRKPIKASFLQKIVWRSWWVVFTSDLPEDTDGLCESQTVEGKPRVGKKIQIREGLEGEYLLETMIHEFMHAALDCLNEEYVDRIAQDLAQLILREEVLRRLLRPWDVQKIVRRILDEREKDLIIPPSVLRLHARRSSEDK